MAGRTQNLKPWSKGVSGSPGGLPKKTRFADACRELLSRPAPGDKSGRSYAAAIAEKLARKALAGDIPAAREIADRAEGKARQAMEVSGPEGGPLDLQFMTDEQLDTRIRELMAIWEKRRRMTLKLELALLLQENPVELGKAKAEAGTNFA